MANHSTTNPKHARPASNGQDHQHTRQETHMNRYQPSMPRAAIGLFATAMTAFTIALAVVVPANMDVSAQQERLLALSNAATRTLRRSCATTRRRTRSSKADRRLHSPFPHTRITGSRRAVVRFFSSRSRAHKSHVARSPRRRIRSLRARSDVSGRSRLRVHSRESAASSLAPCRCHRAHLRSIDTPAMERMRRDDHDESGRTDDRIQSTRTPFDSHGERHD